MSVIDEEPGRAIMNAVARIREILKGTRRVAKTSEASDLIDAIDEQVGEELTILEMVARRVSA